MCNCILCKHSRKEVSDDYFLGYLDSMIEEETSILNNLNKLGFRIGKLSDSMETIGQLMAALECDLNDAIMIRDDFNGEKNGN